MGPRASARTERKLVTLFEKLLRFVSKKPAPPNPPAGKSPFTQLAWIEADKSPFKVRVLDCRSFSRSVLETTADPEIAARFLALRNSTGEQHRGKTPASALPTECLLRYPYEGEIQNGRLFGAQEMEDKWDIYLYDGFLYFARSWTGDLVYRARIDLSEREALVSSIEGNSEAVGGAYTVRSIDFLIKSHLLRNEVPHPLPPNFPDDPQLIALFSIAQYGRWASYATYEDTVPLGI